MTARLILRPRCKPSRIMAESKYDSAERLAVALVLLVRPSRAAVIVYPRKPFHVSSGFHQCKALLCANGVIRCLVISARSRTRSRSSTVMSKYVTQARVRQRCA